MPVDGDGIESRWLLSVERDVPSLEERLHALARRYSLNPTEVEIAERLVEGLWNIRTATDMTTVFSEVPRESYLVAGCGAALRAIRCASRSARPCPAR